MNVFFYIMLLLTVALSAAVLISNRTELRISSSSAVVLALLHTAAGVLCVKVFAGMENFSNPLNAGMSLFGALFFLPAVYWAAARLTKRDMAIIFDDFCFCVMIALMLVRCSCIVNGCCTGKFIPGTGMLWPTRQAEIIFWGLMLCWFLYKKKHGYVKGTLYPLMLMVYGIFRFFIEFLRNEEAVLGGLHYGHIWAVVAFIAGSSAFYYLTERDDQRSRRKNV